VDDTYAINVAQTEYREEFNIGDPERVLSVFAPEFTDNSDGGPSRFGKDAAVKLRRYLQELIRRLRGQLTVIIASILVLGNTAFSWRLAPWSVRRRRRSCQGIRTLRRF